MAELNTPSQEPVQELLTPQHGLHLSPKSDMVVLHGRAGMKENIILLSYGYTGGISIWVCSVVLERGDGTTAGSLLLSLEFRALPE